MYIEKNNSLCNINKYDAHNIGKRIKETAYAQNITVKELCSRAQVSTNAVQQMQAYGKMPRVDTLANIADVLNISIDTLLDRAAPDADKATDTADDLTAAIDTVATAANISPAALCAVLHLQDNK